jgi:tetratricopeptide (TPR) repeat protein
MRMKEQVDTVWALAREGSPEGERLRRRIGAIGALSLLVCGFLASIGLGILVLAFLGGLVVSAGVIAALAAWPELQARDRFMEVVRRIRSRTHAGRVALTPRLRKARGSGLAAAQSTRVHVTPLLLKARGSGLAAAESTRVRVAAGSRGLAQSARATAIRFAPQPARIEPQREAIRLNATGTKHRRNGRYDEAAECHRQALEILSGLGDRRGVALTQSNLALALSHAGDDESAIGLFEVAAATLRDLGDDEREAQIMANLGLTHRRHGRREEGDNVLELALAKLSPESVAYHTIEAELRRAS